VKLGCSSRQQVVGGHGGRGKTRNTCNICMSLYDLLFPRETRVRASILKFKLCIGPENDAKVTAVSQHHQKHDATACLTPIKAREARK
jgi:hypothetical protein